MAEVCTSFLSSERICRDLWQTIKKGSLVRMLRQDGLLACKHQRIAHGLDEQLVQTELEFVFDVEFVFEVMAP